jgi:enoyl-CoA hydratase/carnithine racemase
LTGCMTDTASFTTELSDGILTVQLSSPQTRNAQGPALWRALGDLGESLDAGVRAIVLSAQGPSFSAGMDRRMLTPEGIPGQGSMLEFAGMSRAELEGTIADFQRAFTWWRRSPVVTVAAVGGHAVGAGFQLALACDVMVVGDDVQLSMREPSLGLVPDLGGTLPLVAAVGYSRALELVVSGRWVHAEEAVRIGLALRAVPRDDLDAAAREVARSCATALPGAVSATKALLRDAGHGSGWAAAHDAQLSAERAAQVDRIREMVALMTGPAAR